MASQVPEFSKHDGLARGLVWVFAVITLGFCIAIAIDVTPWIRGAGGPFEWRWQYRPSLVPIRIIGPLIMAGLLSGWYIVARRQERVRLWMIALLVPLGLMLELSVLSMHAHGLQIVARVLNPAYYGYYPPATEHRDLNDFIDHYAELQPELTIHEQVHPPGNVIFLGTVLRAVEAVPALTEIATPYIEPRLETLPDWIDDYSMSEIVGGMVVSLLIPFIGTLAVIPIYLFMREGFDETTARRTAVLYLLMPALTLFVPKMNIPYTLFTGLVFWLGYRGVRDEKLPLIYGMGVLCSLANFMSYSNPLLSIVAAFFTFAASLRTWKTNRAETIKQTAIRMGVLLLGGLTIQIAMMLLFGFDQIESIRVMFKITATYNDVRSYWASLFYTPYDLLVFAGIPAAILFLTRIVRVIREAVQGAWPDVQDWLMLGWLFAVVFIVLTGVQKAENARVFLYMIPAVVIFGAAEGSKRLWNERQFALIAVLAFVQLLVMQVFWEVFL